MSANTTRKGATRPELVRRINVVRANMPTLLRLFPDPVEFHNEFASFVTDLNQLASEQDQEWVTDQIEQILKDHGAAALDKDTLVKED